MDPRAVYTIFTERRTPSNGRTSQFVCFSQPNRRASLQIRVNFSCCMQIAADIEGAMYQMHVAAS